MFMNIPIPMDSKICKSRSLLVVTVNYWKCCVGYGRVTRMLCVRSNGWTFLSICCRTRNPSFYWFISFIRQPCIDFYWFIYLLSPALFSISLFRGMCLPSLHNCMTDGCREQKTKMHSKCLESGDIGENRNLGCTVSG